MYNTVHTLQDGASKISCQGRHIIIVEDIVDTGHTLDRLRRHLLDAGAESVATASLLDKPARREVKVSIDFVGFDCPDAFVIGCAAVVDASFGRVVMSHGWHMYQRSRSCDPVVTVTSKAVIPPVPNPFFYLTPFSDHVMSHHNNTRSHMSQCNYTRSHVLPGWNAPDLLCRYGLDFDEAYRSLPYVGVLHESAIAKAEP